MQPSSLPSSSSLGEQVQLPSISQQPSSSSSSSQQHTSPNVSINTALSALLNEADDDYEPVQYYPPPSLYQSQFFQLPQTTNLYATQYSQPTHPQQPSRTLSPAEIQLAKNKSCSRRNFAARLVQLKRGRLATYEGCSAKIN